ncbi:MAG: UDP-N-acetylmuramoyl-L-alanine--D-glutamate ligase [Lentisphaeria bacterium]|nr:UDP-N-acetylmuramoyl-L-alanine--D-glutamate ligase [Lentisphaeria bacterium]
MMAGQRVLVLGLGESGLAAARLARLHGAEVTVLDQAPAAALRARSEHLEGIGVEVRAEWNGAPPPFSPDLTILSPGIRPSSDLGILAASVPGPVIGELEFGFRHCACPILAVTGTNGKTTTVELLFHCLRKAGYRTAAAGNIGTPLCDAVRRSHLLDVLVVEVSSFQLESVERFAPLGAALLNLTPDHLDRHRTMEEYLAVKLRLFRHVSSARHAVLRADLGRDPRVMAALPAGAARTFSGTDDGASAYVVSASRMLCRREEDGILTPLAAVSELRLRGRHNLENALAALALADAGGFDAERLAPHAVSFGVGPHRLETVAVCNGIRFVNDSKATNPDALCRALDVLATPAGPAHILLIAGGVDKGVSFAGLEETLRRCVKGVFLIGTCRERLAKLWNGALCCRQHASLEAALDAAIEEAVAGDVVLLSPGCASQDMFRDYADRGSRFRDLVGRRFGA